MRLGARLAAAIIILIVGLGFTGAADAQPRRGGPAGSVERREKIKQRIRAMRAYTLTEALALDEQTAGRLFPVLARYDDETDRLLGKRVELQRRLRRVEAERDPRAVERLIDDAVANQRGFWDLEDRRISELRKILTPAQTAKLLVVLPALERRIQNQLRRAISGRRPGAAAAEADENDDDPEPDELPAPARTPRRQRRESPYAPGASAPAAPGNTPPCDPSGGPCR